MNLFSSVWRAVAGFLGASVLVACSATSSGTRPPSQAAAARGVPIPDTQELAGKRYTAVYLAPYPQGSGCETRACRLLDRMEREGYAAARSGTVSWRAFVSWYYEQRAKIYPDSDDSLEVDEMRKLQMKLARQLDLNQISEREWVRELEQKLAAIRAPR